ncbi:MAG TPA: PfkB family carbohydrate kinase, partial [Candidatus Caenarcaniphilales bacterium]|nr:PfkB family carbohydrate kinase [Candidatus Caenarcaniphilales bacterium]
MNEQPIELLDSFARLRVLVIGEAMLDSYLTGRATRLSREAPVPIVAVSERSDMPGGAANAAVNLAALGADVAFLSVIGADADAGVLRQALEERGVSGEHLLADADRRTLTKRRVSAEGQLLVRFDEGSTEQISQATEARLLARLERLFRGVDAVVVSDYAYGVLTPRVIASLAALQSAADLPIIVDAKDVTAYRGVGVTAAKPNYSEAVRLLSEPESDVSAIRVGQVARSAERLLEMTGARIVAVTLDRDGALVFERGQPAYRTYAEPNPHSRAAGAGDTFV